MRIHFLQFNKELNWPFNFVKCWPWSHHYKSLSMNCSISFSFLSACRFVYLSIEAVGKQLPVAKTHIRDWKENIPNTQTPLPAPRKNNNPFLSWSKNKQCLDDNRVSLSSKWKPTNGYMIMACTFQSQLDLDNSWQNSWQIREQTFQYRITESQNSRGWKGPLWVI